MTLDRKLQIASYFCLIMSILTAFFALMNPDKPFMLILFAGVAFLQGILWGARLGVAKRLTWF